uniref:Immunoglobulin V-set domain-containing protein n=1 Tax=Oryzias melastigma TaxID=30732 RepID=A0A3B3C8V1_ORYME
IMKPFFWMQKLEAFSQVTGYIGHNVTLPCSFNKGTQYSNITQSWWEFLSPDGSKTLIMVSSKQHGKSIHESLLKGRVDMEDQSLIIKNVELSDAGSYIYTFFIHPSIHPSSCPLPPFRGRGGAGAYPGY